MLYHWPAGIIITSVICWFLHKKMHSAATAALASFISCVLLIIGVFVFENGSNLWPFVFIIYGVPLFLFGWVVSAALKSSYTNKS